MSLKRPLTKLEGVYKESLVNQLYHCNDKSRRFKIYYQQFNTCKFQLSLAILTFIKIITAQLAEPYEALLESRSIIKEINTIQSIIEIYQRFLSS